METIKINLVTRKPKTTTVYLNVYCDGSVSLHKTQYSATRTWSKPEPDLVATGIPIEITYDEK